MEVTIMDGAALERVSPIQAAAELNMTADSVRYLMREGKLPIGYAIRKEGSQRSNYIIYRGLLDAEKERIANGKNDWN